MRSTTKVADLIIANGSVTSNVLPYYALEDCEAFTLYKVAGGDVGKTYQIQISDDGVTWYIWTDGTSNIVAPVFDSTASTYGNPGAQFVRISASAAVSVQTTWRCFKSGYQSNAR